MENTVLLYLSLLLFRQSRQTLLSPGKAMRQAALKFNSYEPFMALRKSCEELALRHRSKYCYTQHRVTSLSPSPYQAFVLLSQRIVSFSIGREALCRQKAHQRPSNTTTCSFADAT